jgi:hypothetical protein
VLKEVFRGPLATSVAATLRLSNAAEVCGFADVSICNFKGSAQFTYVNIFYINNNTILINTLSHPDFY